MLILAVILWVFALLYVTPMFGYLAVLVLVVVAIGSAWGEIKYRLTPEYKELAAAERAAATTAVRIQRATRPITFPICLFALFCGISVIIFIFCHSPASLIIAATFGFLAALCVPCYCVAKVLEAIFTFSSRDRPSNSSAS